MTSANNAEYADSTQRLLSATPGEVFAAFARPELLTRWWGPQGFSSTFELFEFTPGGMWRFTLHGPDGGNYPNEIIFREIVPNEKVVLDHLGAHPFLLTITLEAQGEDTLLTWVQDHQQAAIPYDQRAIFRAADEQNLDRLEAVLAQF